MADGNYCPTYRWGQTQTHVILTIDVNEECVESHNVTPEGKVTVSGDVPRKGKFELSLDLCGKIVAEEVSVQLLPRTMRLKLPKQGPGVKWKGLQKPGIAKPAQEKKDFDFYMHSDSDDSSEEEDSDEDDPTKQLDAKTRAQMEEIMRKQPPEAPKGRSLLFGPFPNPDEWDQLLLLFALFHIYMAPYTKVEESFNLQATHDVLFHREHLSLYDHHEFPAPLSMLGEQVHAPRILSLYLVRTALAFISVTGLSVLRFQLGRKFGPKVSVSFAVVCCAQFHLLFYASRPLPNTFAAVFVNIAFAYWLQDKYTHMFSILAFAGVVFRSELVLLYTPIFLSALFTNKLGPFPSAPARIIGFSIFWALAGLLLTVGVDSILWRRVVWPEGEVLYYNTVLNKSHEWGTSPWYWYFVSAIPRAMLGGLLFVPGGLLWSTRMRPYALPILGFICLYSILPHKELRFVLYAVPMLNAVAALELTRLFDNRDKKEGRFQSYYFRVAVTILAITLFGSFGFLRISAKNYPGGDALMQLHEMEFANSTRGLRPFVHIDVAAAQQGVSRYLELPEPWRYSKREGEHDMLGYTHLITDKPAVANFTEIIAIQTLNPAALFNPKRSRSVMQTVMRVFKRADLNVALPPLEPPSPAPPPPRPRVAEEPPAEEEDEDDE